MRKGASGKGSASIAVLAGSAFVMVLMLGLLDLSIFFVARTRAQTAADAAALAAAGELIPGNSKGAFEEASRFASANRARLISCDCNKGREVKVLVAIPVRFVLISPVAPDEVRARARAEVDLKNVSKNLTG